MPLQLALAHTLYTEKLYDKHFLDNYCVGFEQFLPYLLGESDGQPKDAQWAQKYAGLMPIRFVNWRGKWRAEERRLLPAGASSVCSTGNSGRG